MSMDRIFSGAGRPGGESAGNGRRYGVDMAKVTNIDDPEKLNRVKCKRITSDPDVGETDWMYVCSPLAGCPRSGTWCCCPTSGATCTGPL